MGRPIEVPPHRVGILTVGDKSEKKGKRGEPMFHCVCDCGKERTVEGYRLKRKDVTSCGCMRTTNRRNATKKHGMKGTPEYAAWNGLKDRCCNPNCPSYPHYGGRGITVCDEWTNSFEAFYEHVGPRPEGFTLDRKDVNGNYEPGNVFWVDQEQQCNNRTNARSLTFNGKTQTIAQWSREVGIGYTTIHRRLLYGWPVELALTKTDTSKHHTVGTRLRIISFDGRDQSISAWARALGVSESLIRQRLDRGWSVEDALTVL